MYQAATTIAVALGYSEDHKISIPPTKYEFLEDVGRGVHARAENALPSVIDMLVKSTAQRQDFYTIHDYCTSTPSYTSSAPRSGSEVRSAHLRNQGSEPRSHLCGVVLRSGREVPYGQRKCSFVCSSCPLM